MSQQDVYEKIQQVVTNFRIEIEKLESEFEFLDGMKEALINGLIERAKKDLGPRFKFEKEKED